MQGLKRVLVGALIFTLLVSLLVTSNQVQAALLTYVQSKIASGSTLVKSYNATFASAVTSGDLIVVATSSWNSTNTASVSSVTDNKGNTYTKVLESAGTGGEPLAVWYAKNVAGGSTFTVSASTTANSLITVAIHEYSGFAAASSF